MAKRLIILRGTPYVNEDGVAAEVIKPGHLVDGVLSIVKHASAGGACPSTYALEREEMGAGIDDSHKGLNTPLSSYQIGDAVKIGSFSPGMRVNVLVASGQNITINDRMESAGNGTMRKFGSGVIKGRALETLGAVIVETRLRMEVM